jgi:hypothetical protein
MMLGKTTLAVSVALAIGAASSAVALEGRDGDNNAVPSGRSLAQRGAPASIASGVFAGPRFVAKRHARMHVRHAHHRS